LSKIEIKTNNDDDDDKTHTRPGHGDGSVHFTEHSYKSIQHWKISAT